MKTEKATVGGKEVVVYIPETEEEALELQRKAAAGEIEDMSGGKPNQPGPMNRFDAARKRRAAKNAAKEAK